MVLHTGNHGGAGVEEGLEQIIETIDGALPKWPDGVDVYKRQFPGRTRTIYPATPQQRHGSPVAAADQHSFCRSGGGADTLINPRRRPWYRLGFSLSEGGRAGSARPLRKGFPPVSYTHLDVYKRQLLQRALYQGSDSLKEKVICLCGDVKMCIRDSGYGLRAGRCHCRCQ